MMSTPALQAVPKILLSQGNWLMNRSRCLSVSQCEGVQGESRLGGGVEEGCSFVVETIRGIRGRGEEGKERTLVARF